MIRFSSAIGSGECRYNPESGQVSTIYFDARPKGVFGVSRRKPSLYRPQAEQVKCSGFVGAFSLVLEDGTEVFVPAEPIGEHDEGEGVFVFWEETDPPNKEEFEEIDVESRITDVERLPGYKEDYFVAREYFRVLRHRITGQIVRVARC